MSGLSVPSASVLSASTLSASALSASALSASARFTMPVPYFYIPFTSTGSDRSAVLVPYSSTPFTFAGSVRSPRPMFDLSAPPTSTPSTSTPATSAPSASTLFASTLSISARSTMPMPGFFAPSISAPFVSTLFTSSGFVIFESGLSASAVPVFGLFAFSRLVITPIPKRRKLIELNQREKTAISKVLAPAFTLLLLSKPLFLFLTNCIGKKRSFNKVFDINSRLLAKNQFGEDVDLSFAGCPGSPTVKTKKKWQQEL